MAVLTSAQNHFKLEHNLVGHVSPVNCLAISGDGTLLVSGGDDAILNVWNVQTGENCQKIDNSLHGPVTCVLWISLKKGAALAFVVGSRDGTLQLYKRGDGVATIFEFFQVVNVHGDTMEDVCFDVNHNRIATVGEGRPQIISLSDIGVMTKLTGISVGPRKYVATNVIFTDDGNNILVFYLESCEVIYYQIEPWECIWEKEVGTRIGFALFCQKSNSIFVSNLCSGVDQYQLPSLHRIATYRHNIARNFQMQVALFQTPTRDYIVTGGDSGSARIFDRQSRHLVDSITHAAQLPGNLVQTVTSNGSIVVTAGSGTDDFRVKIWTLRTAESSFDSAPHHFFKWPSMQRLSVVIFTFQVLLSIILLFAVLNAKLDYPKSFSHITDVLASSYSTAKHNLVVPEETEATTGSQSGFGARGRRVIEL